MVFDWNDWVAYQAGWNEAMAIEDEQRFRAQKHEREMRKQQLEHENYVAQHELRMKDLELRRSSLEKRRSWLDDPDSLYDFSYDDDIETLLYQDEDDFNSYHDDEEFDSYRDTDDFASSYLDDDDNDDDDLTFSCFDDDEDDDVIARSSYEDDEDANSIRPCNGEGAVGDSAPLPYPEAVDLASPPAFSSYATHALRSKAPSTPLAKRERRRIYVAGVAEGGYGAAWKRADTSDVATIGVSLAPRDGEDASIPAVYLNQTIAGYVPNEESDYLASVLASGGSVNVSRCDVTVRPDKKRAGEERVYVWLTVEIEPFEQPQIALVGER